MRLGPARRQHAAQPPVVRRIERGEAETRVVVGSGSDYEAPLGARVEERYEGEVGVSAGDPGRAWARGAARYRIAWPEATVATEARLDLPLIEYFGRGGALKSSWYGDCLPSRDFPLLIDLYLQGRFDLEAFVTERIGLEDVEDAFHKMERGEVLRSVVVL